MQQNLLPTSAQIILGGSKEREMNVQQKQHTWGRQMIQKLNWFNGERSIGGGFLGRLDDRTCQAVSEQTESQRTEFLSRYAGRG